MNRRDWEELIEQLRGRPYQFGLIASGSPLHAIDFHDGLTDAEVIAAQTRFAFQFPPDLREFLQLALPRGPQFPDWRSGEDTTLRDWLDLPRRGLLFDVEHNGFWLEEWGPRPRTLTEAHRIVNDLVVTAPKLIPVYGHRMIPDDPHESGNPVFSVHQTDIIHYGFDLADYLRHEFHLRGRESWPDQVRAIRFWDIDRFQEVRWTGGSCEFDNSEGELP